MRQRLVKLILLFGATVAVFSVTTALYIRFAPMTVARWQIDPGDAHKSGTPNDFLLRPGGTSIADRTGADGVAPVYAVGFPDLARHLLAAALAEPRTTRIAGDWRLGDLTLVQRSRFLGFPDAISIQTESLGPDRSSVAIYSRSRFGHSDAGVNRARVERLLAAVAGDLADPQPAP